MNTLEGVDIQKVVDTAYQAGDAILNIYRTDDFGVEAKSDDSPLTLADRAAHNVILEGLQHTGIPVLSEEGRSIPLDERKAWGMYWLIDPLDGTKEFIKKNGEFTVNIALIKNNIPVFGVVYAPVLDKMYFGGTAIGSSFLIHEKGEKQELPQASEGSVSNLLKQRACKIIASRSHQNQATVDFIEQFDAPELVSMGSSLKFMQLAENKADVYPRFAPTMEWDTGAADAVLQGVGRHVFQVTEHGEPKQDQVQYNKENLINPYFIAY